MPSPLVDTNRIVTLSQDSAKLPPKPAPAAAPGPVWRPSPALSRALAIVAATLLVAVALGRPDFVAIAVPFVFGTAWALSGRPARQFEAALELDDGATLSEGEEAGARVTIRNPNAEPVIAVASAQSGRWLRLSHGVGHYVKTVPGGGSAEVRFRGEARRWGSHRIGPATVHAVACDGLLRSAIETLPPVPVRVYPSTTGFGSAQPLPNAVGIVGIHHSRRAGEGGELAGVRQFQPGDRLRRIDWRVSLRQRELHVNSTLSERDAEVVIVLDVLHEAGRETDDTQTSIMDLT
ncbi:MAG: DUF58 domain-containing protein, partial [Stackebrandtia sp.]